MRRLCQICAVFTLICAFAFSAYAGDIPCPAVTSEPPQGDTTSEAQSGGTDSTVTEALLILIEGVLLA